MRPSARNFTSQRVTKNGMGANIDGLKNGLKSNMEILRDGLRAFMECLKDGLKEDMEGFIKFLQEMLPNGKNVLDETDDENKINFNHDFIHSYVRFKTHYMPKIDMKKFDGKDVVTWTL